MRTKEAYQRHGGVFRFPRDSLENRVVSLDGRVGSVAEAPPDALVGYGTEQANNERVAVDVTVYYMGSSDHEAAALVVDFEDLCKAVGGAILAAGKVGRSKQRREHDDVAHEWRASSTDGHAIQWGPWHAHWHAEVQRLYLLHGLGAVGLCVQQVGPHLCSDFFQQRGLE